MNIGPTEWLIIRLVVVGGAAALFLAWAARVDPSRVTRWASDFGLQLTESNLPLVRRYLRRTRRISVGGAVVGAGVPAMVSAFAPFELKIHPLATALCGYLLGAAVAELTFGRPRTRDRVASLVPRTLEDYLAPISIAGPRVLAGVSAILVPIGLVAGAGSQSLEWAFIASGGGSIVLVALAETAERAVVRRRQPVVAPDLVAADDAIRSSSLHAISAAAMGIVLLLISAQVFALGVLLSPFNVVLSLLGIVCIGMALGCWIHLRKAEGRRVRRTYPVGPIG